jgi:hypothetical protein
MRKSTAMAGGQKANGKDRHTRARRPRYTLIAVSFHQLFLDGLLPSRARLRFTGSPTIYFAQRNSTFFDIRFKMATSF